ncbi:serine/threonine protein kinase [Actinomadura terrae]|uniref:serine/threonine protein kinase n=1 Tax=Actinomadura terrae TaxID=604353 RepID=UPI00234322BE|nr:serine/threonine-protein kinase [Actinomadura terrae]
MPEALPLQPGDPRRLGAYEITGRLGVGEQGAVFLGRDAAGGVVAVKLLHARLSGEPVARSRFAGSFTAARKVSGFCTAAILDADVEGDRAYVVSEWVDGPSLQQLVEEEGVRGGAVVERLAVGAAVALAAVHRAGALHHDLKPGNILLGRAGPRMCDFGIAGALEAVNATPAGRVAEDPAYKAPEQLSGHGIDAPADVFAWAATILFAATGKAPFGDDSPSEIMQRIVYDDPDLSAVPESLREVMADALAKDPTKRPTAKILLARLLDDSAPLAGRMPPAMVEEGRALASSLPIAEPSDVVGQAGSGVADNEASGNRMTGSQSGPPDPTTPEPVVSSDFVGSGSGGPNPGSAVTAPGGTSVAAPGVPGPGQGAGAPSSFGGAGAGFAAPGLANPAANPGPAPGSASANLSTAPGSAGAAPGGIANPGAAPGSGSAPGRGPGGPAVGGVVPGHGPAGAAPGGAAPSHGPAGFGPVPVPGPGGGAAAPGAGGAAGPGVAGPWTVGPPGGPGPGPQPGFVPPRSPMGAPPPPPPGDAKDDSSATDLDPAAFEATAAFTPVDGGESTTVFEVDPSNDQTTAFASVEPDDQDGSHDRTQTAPHLIPGLKPSRESGEQRRFNPALALGKLRRPSNHVLGVALSLIIGVGVGIAIIALVLWPQLKGDDAQPPVDKTGSDRPVTAIPPSFAGTWKGTVVNTNRNVSFPIEVTFETGGRTARAVYPRENCTGTLTLSQGTERTLNMDLVIPKPCTNGTVRVLREPDGTLQYTWSKPGTQLGYAGKLSRS